MSDRPLLIFDGNCGFCRIWIRYWTQLTGTSVEYAPAEGGRSLEAVELVLQGGEVRRGAHAVFTTLRYAPGWGWLAWAYLHVPGFAPVSEAAYRLVAAHRTFFYHLTRLTFGKNISPLRYGGVEWLFLRLLASIYFIAFGSLALQITGLVGERGILSVSRYLGAIHEMYGFDGYRIAPGIFWIAHSDAFLSGACWAGVAISLVLLIGYFERAALVALYLLYLSLCSIGQDFLSFQWDMLLLEAGFLAIFLGSSKGIIYLFRWLAFRLSFLSGAVKLLSHDRNWRSLDALSFHYWTQPLPTPISWYMNQLPAGFQRFSTAVVLFVELPIPFLILMPRRWRFFAAASILALQSMIFLTGNYTFFNLLTMALCIFLFDDAALAKLRLRVRTVRTHRALVAVIAAVILTISGLELWGMFRESDSAIVRDVAPFGIANTYGLFAVMTTTRPEIIVQGSNDGETWLDYEFKYKPGDLKQAPKWVEPYQPRLDWQMWFAALSNYQSNPWFSNFMLRILQGSPEVLRLVAKNPFPNAAPKYIRAEVYEYSFTDRSAQRDGKLLATHSARSVLSGYRPSGPIARALFGESSSVFQFISSSVL